MLTSRAGFSWRLRLARSLVVTALAATLALVTLFAFVPRAARAQPGPTDGRAQAGDVAVPATPRGERHGPPLGRPYPAPSRADDLLVIAVVVGLSALAGVVLGGPRRGSDG